MKVLVKLFTTQSRASDNSLIPRSVVETYLQSEEYKNAIDRGLMIGSKTHLDRNISARGEEAAAGKGTIGKDDNILRFFTGISVIEKIFLPEDPSDEWVYAIQRFFNPDDMDEESAKSIRQIEGMIKNGVKISTSAVVIGYWNEDEVCERLVQIRGNDVTLNPAFSKGGKDMAGVIKVLEE